MADPRWRAGRPLQQRSAAVNRELSLAVQDDEHLLALIVEVRTDSAARRENPAMKEVEVCSQIELRHLSIPRSKKLHVVHRAGAIMHRGHMAKLRGVRMRNSFRNGDGRQLLTLCAGYT